MKIKKALLFPVAILLLGFIVPQRAVIPVQGASPRDWNAQSFWYAPWGISGVHKGIDIFARKGTPVLAATQGVVLFQGEIALGGRVIAILGPKWRVHYYAHLDSARVQAGKLLSTATMIGTVGDSGNAVGKPPHLHYAVVSLLPYPWRWDRTLQGWKKMFFLDPAQVLSASLKNPSPGQATPPIGK